MLKDTVPSLESYRAEFEEIRVKKNIEVCRLFTIILIIINVLLIVVDLTVYKPFAKQNPAYIRLFYSHIVMLVLCPVWLKLSYNNFSGKNIFLGRLLCHLLMLMTMYWGVFLGLNDLSISGQISAYVICVFSISTVLFINPSESVWIYFISLCVFVTGLVLLVGDKSTLISHIINTFSTVIVAFTITKLRYDSFLKDFAVNKELSSKKAETEEAYFKLEESNHMLKNEIKERRLAEEKIIHLIYYDALTGIFNRKKVLEELSVLLIHNEEKFAVLFIDLDKFKDINDRYGHETGDLVLKIAATRLKKIIGPKDTISRIGGDEFIVILRGIEDSAYAEKVAATIVFEMGIVFSFNEKKLHIGASVGISLFPEDGMDADKLFNKADQAMYRIKKMGGSGYRFHDKSESASTQSVG